MKTKRAKAKVEFDFKADEPGASFECRLDNAEFAACDSGQIYKVGVGSHIFEVRAVAAAGNSDPSPDTRSFKVVRTKRR